MRTRGGRRLAVAVALAALAGAGAAAAQTVFSPAQDPLAGSRAFGAKGCVQCHAVNGVGGKVGPDLGRVPRPRTFFDLASALWNHAPRMAVRMRQLGVPRPDLDARETGDLVAFLFTADYFDRKGRADVGRRLFVAKRCVTCHQAGGTGGVIGPSLDALQQRASPIYLATALWNHGPQMAEVMRAQRVPRPTFQDGDLADLIAYLGVAAPGAPPGPVYVLQGRAAEGRTLFAQKGCQDCHRAGGQGGTLGPDLAERSRAMSLLQFATAMWNKAPRMLEAMQARAMAVPQLRPEEMADIVAYLYSVRYFAGAGDPGRGARLLSAKGCLECHAGRGEPRKLAGDLSRARGLESAAAVLSALWNHSFVEDPRPEPVRGRWAEISPAEMADLIGFLQTPPRP
jgi:mono/diheme cytochrome c family protein